MATIRVDRNENEWTSTCWKHKEFFGTKTVVLDFPYDKSGSEIVKILQSLNRSDHVKLGTIQ